MLYTDLTELSSDFSSTFRGVNNYEPLQSIKHRNSHYYWMSRYLRECVQIFGTFSDLWNDPLTGPFYCGLSKQLLFPEYQMRLCSPCSTSYHEEVAITFSGDAMESLSSYKMMSHGIPI